MFVISLFSRLVICLGVMCSARLFAQDTYTVGQYAQGGVIFWLTPDQEHGLVAAIVDQDGGDGIQWFNNTYVWVNASADGCYLGALDTQAVVAAQSAGTYAAAVAQNYSVMMGGMTYADWYLPSTIELDMMYLNVELINNVAVTNGGTPFAAAVYWSSNDTTSSIAQARDFSSGSRNDQQKNYPGRVRAIRAF